MGGRIVKSAFKELSGSRRASAILGMPRFHTENDPIVKHHKEILRSGKEMTKNGKTTTVRTIQVIHPDLNDGKPTLIPSYWGEGKLENQETSIRKAIAAQESGTKWTSADTHEELRNYDSDIHSMFMR